MNPNPTETSHSRSASLTLNPVLQAALHNLDVQLEEELTRYRRQRSGRPAPPPRGLNSYQPRKPLDLIAVTATGGRTQPTPAETPAGAMPAPTQMPAQISASYKPPVPTYPLSTPSTAQPPSPPVSAPVPAIASASELISIAPELESASTEATPNATNDAESFALERVIGELTNVNTPSPEPDGYLESSEALLRSLAAEEASGATPSRFMPLLGTPLGIGSMLLLLLASASLGYVLINPTSLQHLGLGRVAQTSSPAPEPSSASTGTVPASPENPSLANSPDLATQEFVDLNLSTLTTLKPNPGTAVSSPTVPVPPVTPTPTGVTSPTLPTVPTPAPSIAPAPAPITPGIPLADRVMSAPPAPPAIAPVPATVPLAPQPAASFPVTPVDSNPPTPIAPDPVETSADNSGYYYVVTPYNTDLDLQEARQLVPEAYVRNSGGRAQIQLGAFGDKTGAEELVQQLRQQGLTADVYKP